MKTVAIIKASSISKNFPDRYKLRLGGKSILGSIVKRIQESKIINENEIVLATTNDSVDEQRASRCKTCTLVYEKINEVTVRNKM
jgi:spore coat polysaccharide biosynthesis protein SpsF (cytidylyltransferase family)